MQDSRKFALVTGVGGYLGSSIASQLNNLGYLVVGIDRTDPLEPDSLIEFHKFNLGNASNFGTLDLTDYKFEHVFHAAGGASKAEVEGSAVTPKLADETFRDNFYSALDLLASLKDSFSPGAGLVLVSSINAFGNYGLPVYSSAKAALQGWTLAMASDFERQNLRINCLALGTIDHPGVRKLHKNQPGHFERLATQFPNGSIPTAKQMAQSIIEFELNSTSNGTVRVIAFGQMGI
jgi:NAD(P)-dependent dehydrogenase (short-subunit alcohol dehydrogenase family)